MTKGDLIVGHGEGLALFAIGAVGAYALWDITAAVVLLVLLVWPGLYQIYSTIRDYGRAHKQKKEIA
jgi:hypothetical protein